MSFKFMHIDSFLALEQTLLAAPIQIDLASKPKVKSINFDLSDNTDFLAETNKLASGIYDSFFMNIHGQYESVYPHLDTICINGDGVYVDRARACQFYFECIYTNSKYAQIYERGCPEGYIVSNLFNYFTRSFKFINANNNN
jgi:hypothetical protein